MQLFSQFAGALLLIGYGGLMWLLIWALNMDFSQDKLSFLVANRKIEQWAAAFSIAATWIWAPALFIASQKAYTQGIVGVFWFTVPNVACLIIFAYFASRVREKMPDGFTLSGFVRRETSARCQKIYLFQLIGLATCSFAVQLLAGGIVVANLTGLNFYFVVVALSLIALSYSFYAGMRASIMTDYAQMLIILAVGAVCIPWAVSAAGGWSYVAAGLGGKSGTFTSLFSGDGGAVFWSFGIPVTVGLLSGPFGDQTFWQRAFSIREGHVKGAFIKGAFIFAIVPVVMSILGFLAAGKALSVADTQLVNLSVILEYLPAWMAVPFTYMLLSGLVSTLDSNICAVASLTGHDMRGEHAHGSVVAYSRTAILIFCAGAVAIACIPGMQILYLFLFYGTLRASTLLPTIILILRGRVSEAGMFYGILASICLGLPIFAVAKFAGSVPWIVFGSLFTVLVSGAVTYFMSTRVKAAAGEV